MRKSGSSNNLFTGSKIQLSWGSTVQLTPKLRAIERIYFLLWNLVENILKDKLNDYICSIIVIRGDENLFQQNNDIYCIPVMTVSLSRRERGIGLLGCLVTRKEVYETWVHTTAASIYFYVLTSSTKPMFCTHVRFMEIGLSVFFLFFPLFCTYWTLLFNRLRLKGLHTFQHYLLVYWMKVVEHFCWRIHERQTVSLFSHILRYY